jgi:hypothetical protein
MHGWFWRVLPYFDANPLYGRIDFNRPWDDPENDYLFQSELRICLNPSAAPTTSAEGYGLLHHLANPHVLHRNSSVTFDEMTDGTQQTWLLGEAGGDFTPYGYPFNWRALGERLNHDEKGYGLPASRVTLLLMADGSVAESAAQTSPDVLRKLAAAPPVPAEQDIVTPANPRTYRYSGRRETAIDLEGSGFHGVQARALLDRGGTPLRVQIASFGKGYSHAPTIDHLRQTAAAFPAVSELRVYLVIDDDAAKVLASLADLEVLEAQGVSVSDGGLEQLAVLSKLRKLSLKTLDDESMARLRDALPECEIEEANAP